MFHNNTECGTQFHLSREQAIWCHFKKHRCPGLIAVGSGLVIFFGVAGLARAITITVDYQYDTNSFFDTDARKDALQAAADRYSAIITTSLGAVSLSDDSTDPRIGFRHPGTGIPWDVSPANSQATDALAGTAVAEEYRGPWSIAADEWILYAGGRSMSSAGMGGTGTGLNFTTVFADGDSVLNRGFRASGSPENLPVWGGFVTFDNDGGVNWHFDHTTSAPFGTVDFYSMALHEIGHALGLSTSWQDWMGSGGSYTGPNAITAYNADNGASVTSLNEVSALNHHWEDGAYDSKIFASANPNLTGTVGSGNLQDLLMEPVANFTSTVRRFELTNVDVAALEDIGWTVVLRLGDVNLDGELNELDVDPFLELLLNGPYQVQADMNGDGQVNGLDVDLFVSAVGSGGSVTAVPEPSTFVLVTVGLLALAGRAPGGTGRHRHV